MQVSIGLKQNTILNEYADICTNLNMGGGKYGAEIMKFYGSFYCYDRQRNQNINNDCSLQLQST